MHTVLCVHTQHRMHSGAACVHTYAVQADLSREAIKRYTAITTINLSYSVFSFYKNIY